MAIERERSQEVRAFIVRQGGWMTDNIYGQDFWPIPDTNLRLYLYMPDGLCFITIGIYSHRNGIRELNGLIKGTEHKRKITPNDTAADIITWIKEISDKVVEPFMK